MSATQFWVVLALLTGGPVLMLAGAKALIFADGLRNLPLSFVVGAYSLVVFTAGIGVTGVGIVGGILLVAKAAGVMA